MRAPSGDAGGSGGRPEAADRLYRLLPAYHRQRDAEAGEPLRALLGVIAEQVAIVDADIERLLDNWFIETCDPWVVPYIGELLGLHDLDSTAGAGRATASPRRDVGNAIRQRRRKGSAALLDALAAEVGGWPCRAVEFGRRLAATQSLAFPRPGEGGTLDVRDARAAAQVGSPFDRAAHGVDVRRPPSRRSAGRHNLASIGVFVWRLRVFAVTQMPACCVDRSETACYTFSILGNDAPLFNRVPPAAAAPRGPGGMAGADSLANDVDDRGGGGDRGGGDDRGATAVLGGAGTRGGAAADADTALDRLPAPLTRAALADRTGRVAERHYGAGRSLALWRRTGAASTLIDRDTLVVADLSGWRMRPRAGTVAVDPELGRIAFAADEAPEDGLTVSYQQGFGDALGGGEYPRPVSRGRPGRVVYLVGQGGESASLAEALDRWKRERPAEALIEIATHEVQADLPVIELAKDQRLEIRAARDTRPLIVLRDRKRDARDFLQTRGAAGSRLTLAGLLVAGRGLQARGRLAALTISHCTLVPGWDPTEDFASGPDLVASLRLENVAARVVVEHSVIGSIAVVGTIAEIDPPDLVIRDSIVDATAPQRRAIDSPERQPARVRLTVLRSTLIGRVHVSDMPAAGDSLFVGEVRVARRQAGCLRFCHVPLGSRTPRRYGCQPDLALEANRAAPEAAVAASVAPRFASLRYGTPDYARLADDAPREIAEGAEDGGELGVFHRLDEPRRMARLQARLEAFVPAESDVGIIRAD